MEACLQIFEYADLTDKHEQAAVFYKKRADCECLQRFGSSAAAKKRVLSSIGISDTRFMIKKIYSIKNGDAVWNLQH